MDKVIELRVLTSHGIELEDEAVAIRTPGASGYIGILRSHAPLVTTVKPGRLTWRRPGGNMMAVRVGRGLLEISSNRFTLLTDFMSETSDAISSPGAPHA